MSHVKYSVEFGGFKAQFLSGGQWGATVAFDDIRAFYEVTAGSDVMANDSEFWIIQLTDKLVIVPEDTVGILALMLRWEEPLKRHPAAFEAVCYLPPKAWRRNWWGLFSHYQTKLCIVDKVDYQQVMPEWKILGPWRPLSEIIPKLLINNESSSDG